MSSAKPANPTINRSHPLARGLVGAWAFQDRGGTTLHDVSGHGHNGTLTNMELTDWSSGRYGGTLVLGGTDEIVEIPDHDDFAFGTDQSFSISIVAKRTVPGEYQGLCGKNTGTRAIWFRWDSNDVVTFFMFSGSGSYDLLSSTATFTDTTHWYHIVVVADRANYMRIYVDGVMVAEDTSLNGGDVSTTVAWMLGDIGPGAGDPDLNEFTDFKVWGRALGAGEVATMFAGDDLYSPALDTFERHYHYPPLPRPPIAEKGVAGGPGAKAVSVNHSHPLARGLVAAYAFEDGGGLVLRDVSGHGHNGTLTNMELTDWSSGRYGGTLVLGGTDEIVDIPDHDDFAFGATQGFSFSVVCRRTTPGAQQAIVGKGDATRSWWVRWESSDIIRFFAGYSPSVHDLIASTATFTDTTHWYHIVAVADRANYMRLYVDGVLVAEDTSLNGGDLTNSLRWTLGDVGPGAADPHENEFTDFKVWGRALGAGEVAAMFAGDDLYSPAVGTFERYYRARGPAGQPAYRRHRQLHNQPLFGRGF